jgi:3-oxoacyl-[acyl-carrier-protein] synthase II
MKNPQIPVVITGMGVMTPLGCQPDQLWSQIKAGATSHRAWDDLADAGYRHTSACRMDLPEHDPLRRGQYLALEAVRQALGQAQFAPKPETGIFLGSTMGESAAFEAVAAGENLHLENYGVASFGQAIARQYAIERAPVALTTACAAGNYAVGMAMQAIQSGQVQTAIAGGAEPFSRLAMLGFSRSRAMSADACKPFAADRSGMLLGEGAAVFVLERADRALARGVQPLAIVRSMGLSCDAYHPTAPLPDGSGVATAIRLALKQGELESSQIDWINTHGSGTRLSDAAESQAIYSVFGEQMPFCSGSKGALGHALGAASAIELALCVMGLQHQCIPPTAGHHMSDPDCPIICSQTPIQQPVEHVLNSAYAFGGLNSALILSKWNA